MNEMPPPMRDAVHGVAPHRGTLILVLGIISLTACAPIGIAAWVMGMGDLRKMRRGMMDPQGKGLTTGGMVCGIVASALLVLLALLYVLIAVIFGAAALWGARNP